MYEGFELIISLLIRNVSTKHAYPKWHQINHPYYATRVMELWDVLAVVLHMWSNLGIPNGRASFINVPSEALYVWSRHWIIEPRDV